MQQSQQKRTQFRQQIRKRQISDLFNNIRKLNKERQRMRQQNVEISKQEKQQMKKRITDIIGKCFVSFHYKHFKSLSQGIQMLGKLVDSDVRLVSAALQMVTIQHGGFIVEVLKKQINGQTLQKICSQFGVTVQENIIAQEIPNQGTIDLVNKLMNMSRRIQYNKFSIQAAKKACNILWQILQQNLHFPPQPQKPTQPPHPQLLQNLCLSLNSLLDSPNHKPIKKHLQQLGLSQKLNQIIDKSVELEVSVHSSILKLVFLFNGTDSNVQDLLNGITIISTDSTFKEKYVLYCIFFIRKKYRQLLSLALVTLNQIFQECPYFIDSIKTDYYDRVLQLVLDQDRNINVAALNVLSSIIFYSQSASDQLIQQTNILDYIYSRLIIQRNLPSNEPNSKKSIQRCSNILCDLLMTKNNKLKKILFPHHIWQLLYQSIQENNRLFSTIVVFKFFFTNISRKDRMQILPSFLEAVGRLPLQNDMIPEIKDVMETLLYIFYHSMEHNDQNHEQIVRLFQTNNLIKHMQNYEAEYYQNYKMTKE